MKTGFCLHGDWLISKPDLVEKVDQLGYDGIEIWAQAFETVGIDGVKAAVAPYRMEAASINPYFDFTSSEDACGESLKMAADYVGYARRLECSRLRSSREATPEQWQRAIRGMRTVCDIAVPYGIQCVMEVHKGDGQLFDTSPSALRICQGVDRPNLTMNVQPPLMGEPFQESVEKLGPYVTHLHANNWKGEWGNFVYLDQGDVDFADFLRSLRKCGFDGFVSVEHSHSDPFGFAEHNIKYLRKIFRELETSKAE